MRYQKLLQLRRARREQLKRQKALNWKWGLVLIILFIALVIYGSIKKQTSSNFSVKAGVVETKQEVTKQKTVEVSVVKEVVVEKEKVVLVGSELDRIVDKNAKRFSYGSVDRYSELKAVLHCLLYFESKHTAADGHGDNGKAGGPFQFWEDTYNGYRRIMIKAELTDHIGSRYDLEDATETTAWALTDGRGKAWGPILRGECMNLKGVSR